MRLIVPDMDSSVEEAYFMRLTWFEKLFTIIMIIIITIGTLIINLWEDKQDDINERPPQTYNYE